MGLDYTTVGETSLIGIHKEGNYGRVIGETHALMGMKLFAEYLDGIAVVSMSDDTTLGTLTVTSAAGTKTGDTKVTVSPGLKPDNCTNTKWQQVRAGSEIWTECKDLDAVGRQV